MATTQRFCMAVLLLLVLICSHGGVEQVSGSVCNLKIGNLKKCNAAIKDTAQNPKNAGDSGNPSPDAPGGDASTGAPADTPAEAPASDSPDDAPPADSPAGDSSASAADNSAAAADAPAGEASADLTVADDADADADPGSDNSNSGSSDAAHSECCQKAMEADIGCLCSFFSQRMVTVLHVVENFVNKLADMCDIKLNGCT